MLQALLSTMAALTLKVKRWRNTRHLYLPKNIALLVGDPDEYYVKVVGDSIVLSPVPSTTSSPPPQLSHSLQLQPSATHSSSSLAVHSRLKAEEQDT